jgi:hypothetical protein
MSNDALRDNGHISAFQPTHDIEKGELALGSPSNHHGKLTEMIPASNCDSNALKKRTQMQMMAIKFRP